MQIKPNGGIIITFKISMTKTSTNKKCLNWCEEKKKKKPPLLHCCWKYKSGTTITEKSKEVL